MAAANSAAAAAGGKRVNLHSIQERVSTHPAPSVNLLTIDAPRGSGRSCRPCTSRISPIDVEGVWRLTIRLVGGGWQLFADARLTEVQMEAMNTQLDGQLVTVFGDMKEKTLRTATQVRSLPLNCFAD